jgi:hypothetical protein
MKKITFDYSPTAVRPRTSLPRCVTCQIEWGLSDRTATISIIIMSLEKNYLPDSIPENYVPPYSREIFTKRA